MQRAVGEKLIAVGGAELAVLFFACVALDWALFGLKHWSNGGLREYARHQTSRLRQLAANAAGV